MSISRGDKTRLWDVQISFSSKLIHEGLDFLRFLPRVSLLLRDVKKGDTGNEVKLIKVTRKRKLKGNSRLASILSNTGTVHTKTASSQQRRK